MMDEKFLEFWGNLLLNAARGKKQADDMSGWMKKSFDSFSGFSGQKKDDRGLEDMWAMFRKFYGLDQFSERSSEHQNMMKKAAEDFQNSYNDYLTMMGMVSKKEHLALVGKYEKLKAKCADQEETIRHLQMLADAKDTDQVDAVKGLQDILKDQTAVFQKTMSGFGQMFTKKEVASANQTEADKHMEGNVRKDGETTMVKKNGKATKKTQEKK